MSMNLHLFFSTVVTSSDDEMTIMHLVPSDI